MWLPWKRRGLFGVHLRNRRLRWQEDWQDEGKREYLKKFFYKHVGKAYAADKGVRVPDTFALLDSIDELPALSELPGSFVLKPFRGSSSRSVFVVGEGMDLYTDNPISRDAIVEGAASSSAALDFTQAGDQSRFLIEELIIGEAADNGIPLDFKFYQFGRKLAFVHVVERNDPRSASKNRHWFFDHRWRVLENRVQRSQAVQQIPFRLMDELIQLAETAASIAGDLDIFVRVDLYLSKGEAVFGELTALPHGGNGYTPEADKWLGGLWCGLEGSGGADSYAARAVAEST